MPHVELGHLRRRQDEVVHERRVDEVAVLVVGNGFEERAAYALRGRPVRLPPRRSSG